MEIRVGNQRNFQKFFLELKPFISRLCQYNTGISIVNRGEKEMPYYAFSFTINDKTTRNFSNDVENFNIIIANICKNFIINYLMWQDILRKIREKLPNASGETYGKILYKAGGILREKSSYHYDILNLTENPHLANAIKNAIENKNFQNNYLDLEGFFHFNLENYTSEINFAIENAILEIYLKDGLVMEKGILISQKNFRNQHEELIYLLNNYMAKKESYCNKLIVIFSDNRQFLLLNEENMPLNIEKFPPLAECSWDFDLYQHLLANLLFYAPKELEINIKDYTDERLKTFVTLAYGIWKENFHICFYKNPLEKPN